ncbi:trimethyllysine dioxygenase, mitochondrial [Teleopsis dalmanni]|uniref:trimethyllysine dioxygenase, mitochondrial n=1 Tax=Teleopsis dalmanni TaxID=139649 RepID=UPI0018CF5500|nr:trimethyllysine dioxygenase, mitochondrial [Teleopsis dalmanni]
MLEIENKRSGKVLKVDPFWLRDHCRCNNCINVETKQRKYNLLDIPEDVEPLFIKFQNDGTFFDIEWSDNHSSTYDFNFLYQSLYEQVSNSKQHNTSRTPWNRSIILQNERHLRVNLTDLISSDGAVKTLVSALIRYGIAFIDEVPPNAEMTELAIRRVFPIMKTFFGEMWTFSDVKDHADTAYTKEYLGSHTDNTYFCDAAGLQILHCLSHENGMGGENFFVDGLHAAKELYSRHLNAFELLKRVQVPGEYVETSQYHKYSAPMIHVDDITDEIIQLRLNVYDRALFNTIPQTEMSEFYDAFRKYLKIVQSSDSQWTLKLQPGTLVLFDNWRVFHGRLAYTGSRTMSGCYVQRTDFLSKARVLGLIE